MTVTGTESVRTDDRRTLRLTFEESDLTPPRPHAPASPVVADRPPPRRTTHERLLVIAERLLGGWAPTLHLALLLVAAMIAGLVVIGLLAGAVPALISAAVLVATTLVRRR
ncbi:hypothetical protein [Actinokineospora sp. NBRC 105648]|uniref:hypothetical protein n=1 Tax=Actinokineospora sp. NBRC 105648 TaxID=3032206 RepID=UPI0024A0CC26|nr:hypothetical protein [Actinokineospora sp. NBRC 105648]GLZ37474.1 hypothetical protein Acsp05_10990 [Actinokineospora sp. NBRC 105648]